MKTLYEVMDGSSRDKEKLRKAGEILKAGGLVAFPTETVYGLGGDALNPESSRKIYAAKGRPSDNPLIVHICRLSDLEKIAWDPDGKGLKVARAFWPGPLTLIVKASDAVPPAFRSAEDTIGLRMPNNHTALELIRRVGVPLATTSANVSGCKPPKSFDDINRALLDRVAAFLDDDQEKSGVASTILDCTKEHPTVVREGAITIQDIAALS